PADPFRPEARYTDSECAARFQDAMYLIQRLPIVRNVFQHFRADDLVEACIGEGQRERIAHRKREGALRLRVHIRAGAEALARAAHILEAEVNADHMALSMVIHGVNMPSCATTKVERALA